MLFLLSVATCGLEPGHIFVFAGVTPVLDLAFFPEIFTHYAHEVKLRFVPQAACGSGKVRQ
jgi:hypothetical protein